MFILLFPFFVLAAREQLLASGEKQIDKNCARMILASIYGAEKFIMRNSRDTQIL